MVTKHNKNKFFLAIIVSKSLIKRFLICTIDYYQNEHDAFEADIWPVCMSSKIFLQIFRFTLEVFDEGHPQFLIYSRPFNHQDATMINDDDDVHC